MGMSSQAHRFQEPNDHTRHSVACNRQAKSKNRVCAASISVIADRMLSDFRLSRHLIVQYFRFSSNDLAIIET